MTGLALVPQETAFAITTPFEHSTSAHARTMSPQLTVGVEAEGILIFRKHHLRQVLQPGHEIITDGLDADGNKLNAEVYPSGWATRSWNRRRQEFDYGHYYWDERQEMVLLMVDGGERETKMTDGGEEAGVVPGDVVDFDYDEQPASGAEGKMSSEGLSTKCDDLLPEGTSLSRDQVKPSYKTRSGLTIEPDESIRRITKKQKIAMVLDGDESTDDTDTIDIEVVTGIYHCNETKDEIQTLMADMATFVAKVKTSGGGIGTKKDCGLHVHVSYSDGSRLPLRVLKIFAFH